MSKNNTPVFGTQTTKVVSLKLTEMKKLTTASDAEVYLPEVLDDRRIKALQADIEANGQLHPIVVDETGVVWDGRSRLKACLALRKPIKAIRIKRSQGHKAAMAGLLQREMTVLDEVRLVKWIRDAHFSTRSKRGSGSTRDRVASWCKQHLGWHRRSGRQVGIMLSLAGRLDGASKTLLRKLRNAESVAAIDEELKAADEKKPSAKRAPRAPNPAVTAKKAASALYAALREKGLTMDEELEKELSKVKRTLERKLKSA